MAREVRLWEERCRHDAETGKALMVTALALVCWCGLSGTKGVSSSADIPQLHCAVLCCAVCCAVLCCTVLCSALLYSAVLCCVGALLCLMRLMIQSKILPS